MNTRTPAHISYITLLQRILCRRVLLLGNDRYYQLARTSPVSCVPVWPAYRSGNRPTFIFLVRQLRRQQFFVSPRWFGRYTCHRPIHCPAESTQEVHLTNEWMNHKTLPPRFGTKMCLHTIDHRDHIAQDAHLFHHSMVKTARYSNEKESITHTAKTTKLQWLHQQWQHTPWVKKGATVPLWSCPFHNFTKWRPIFDILSLLDAALNL